jgi:hypothetical protein
MLPASRQFRIPKRGNVPVVLAISLFHMVAFAALMTTGLKYVPVGRSIGAVVCDLFGTAR